jgi:hypothetical protein
MCTFKKGIKNFEVHVDVQKGVLRFRGKYDVLVSSNHVFIYCWHIIIISMTTMSIIVRVCIWVLGFHKSEALGQLIGCLCVLLSKLWLSYYAIVFVCLMKNLCELHAMGKMLLNDFLFGSEFHR